MQCNACGGDVEFRARAEDEPFVWWCKVCYGKTFAMTNGHTIEHPIACCDCNELPAAWRIISKAIAEQSYWCQICYERYEHEDLLHDVKDIESPSSEEQEDQEDEQEEPEDDPD